MQYGGSNPVSVSTNNFTVKRLAINAFLLFHLAVIVSWSIPSQALVFRIVRHSVSPYAWRAGLFQSWDMFAPNPTHTNAFVTAEITCSKGQVRVWSFPQMQDLGYSERYFKERYRKFSNDRLILKTNAILLPDAARYIARLNADPFNQPRIVKLIRYVSVISPPPAEGQAPQLDRWQRDVFFTYSVKAGDLL